MLRSTIITTKTAQTVSNLAFCAIGGSRPAEVGMLAGVIIQSPDGPNHTSFWFN
jgi:hypothetical protein